MSFGGSAPKLAPQLKAAPERLQADGPTTKEINQRKTAEKSRQNRATGRASLVFSQGSKGTDADNISVKKLLGG